MLLAQDTTTRQFLQEAGYTTFQGESGDIRIFIAGLIQAVLSVVGIIFLIVIIYGGYLWLTAGGNEQQLERARGFVTQAIIGFVVVLGALIITRAVVGAF